MKRFACQKGCTKCCSRRGSVYLSQLDLEQAAEYLGMTPQDFETRYVVRYRHVLRLRRPPYGQEECEFLTAEGCSIHPVKPTQCRTYPFWPTLIQNRESWNEEARFCPGIGKGDLVQIKTARAIAEEMTNTFPTLDYF